MKQEQLKKLAEEWKPLKDWEEYYEISNYGKLKTLRKTWIAGKGSKMTRKEQVLPLSLNKKDGYVYCGLYKNGKSYSQALHRLVWDNFGDKPRNGRKLIVDHKDDNRSNNRIDNLQLLTSSENSRKRAERMYRLFPEVKISYEKRRALENWFGETLPTRIDENVIGLLEDKMIEELDVVRIEINRCFGGGWKAMYLNEKEDKTSESLSFYSDVVAVDKGKTKNEARLNAIFNYVEKK